MKHILAIHWLAGQVSEKQLIVLLMSLLIVSIYRQQHSHIAETISPYKHISHIGHFKLPATHAVPQ